MLGLGHIAHLLGIGRRTGLTEPYSSEQPLVTTPPLVTTLSGIQPLEAEFFMVYPVTLMPTTKEQGVAYSTKRHPPSRIKPPSQVYGVAIDSSHKVVSLVRKLDSLNYEVWGGIVSKSDGRWIALSRELYGNVGFGISRADEMVAVDGALSPPTA